MRTADSRLTTSCPDRRSSPRQPLRCAAQAKGATRDRARTTFHSVESESDYWRLDRVAEVIAAGGVGVIPTDTTYVVVCDLESRDAVARLYATQAVRNPLSKPLSLLCADFAAIATYTLGLPAGTSGQPNLFRVAKACLPGGYTLILPASKALPKACLLDKKGVAVCKLRRTVGVRIPADPVCAALLARLPRPLLCTSVRAPPSSESDGEWLVDPAAIADALQRLRGDSPDFVVDAGVRLVQPSTVVDLAGPVPRLLRAGLGDPAPWLAVEGAIDARDAPREEEEEEEE